MKQKTTLQLTVEKVKRTAQAAEYRQLAADLIATGHHDRAASFTAKADRLESGEALRRSGKSNRERFNSIVGGSSVEPIAMGIKLCGMGIATFMQQTQSRAFAISNRLAPDAAVKAINELWETVAELLADPSNLSIGIIDSDPDVDNDSADRPLLSNLTIASDDSDDSASE